MDTEPINSFEGESSAIRAVEYIDLEYPKNWSVQVKFYPMKHRDLNRVLIGVLEY